MNGIELIAKERQEQVEKHGITVESDVEINSQGELAQVASLLAYKPFMYAQDNDDIPDGWDREVFLHMYNKNDIERLSIAGALIAAEIDRLQAIS